MRDDQEQLVLWPDMPSLRPPVAAIRPIKRPRPQLAPRDTESSRYVPLVLASASSSRVNILRLLGLRFKVAPADLDESAVAASTPEDLVSELAFRKALSVSQRHSSDLTLAADTLIIDGDGIIGKPNGIPDARRTLERLSGASHRVVTGLAVVDGTSARSVRKVTTTTVRFRAISSGTIERYLRTGEPIGKAGGYALQGIGALLVESVDGEYSNVLGLPVATFVDALFELGYELI